MKTPEVTVHRVYWTEDGLANSKNFGPDSIDATLKFCESLRKQRKEGADISFITMASEIPECTSLQGIQVAGPEYDWKKRRP